MEDLAKDMIDAAIDFYFNLSKHFRSDIKEQMRRDELRKGSIDVEYRVIK